MIFYKFFIMDSRSKNWCFTNNTPDNKCTLASIGASYLIQQLEKAPDTGHLHYQGFCQFKSQHYFHQLHDKYPYHWEVAHDPKASVAYCKKEDTRVEPPVEEGEFSCSQGKRSDLESIRNEIWEGSSSLTIADNHFSQWVYHHRSFEQYRSLLKRSKLNTDKRDVKVTVSVGPAGTGKTWDVFTDTKEEKEHAYWHAYQTNTDFWDIDTDTTSIILDDYAGTGCCRWTTLLRVLDIYPVRLGTKGQFTTLDSVNKVFITSAKRPKHWYTNTDIIGHFDQLIRRVDTWKYYKSRNKVYVFEAKKGDMDNSMRIYNEFEKLLDKEQYDMPVQKEWVI